MHRRPLGKTGLSLSPIGFGAFKIGRNQNTKYPSQYQLPDESAVGLLLNACLDLGINYIDTAAAYGASEERIGQAISHRRTEFVLSTKAGEFFENGQSRYDFSRAAIEESVRGSLSRLRTDRVDLLLLHANADDLHVVTQTDAVATLRDLKAAGQARFIGLSAKTDEAARAAMDWADALMLDYSIQDRSHEAVIAEASRRGIGVIAKKGLGSGHLNAEAAIEFVLANQHISSLLVGSLNIEHLAQNVRCGWSVEWDERSEGPPCE